MNLPAPVAILIAFVMIVIGIVGCFELSRRLDPPESRRPRRRGRHERDPFAGPAGGTDPDEMRAATAWLNAVNHEPEPPAAELPPRMLPAPLAETAELPVAVCELGMPTEEYVDALFAKYAEVTS